MLQKKIDQKQSGILFYGMTPPKINHNKTKLQKIASKQIDRISKLNIDGIILYDIQDESQRTDKKRPFPFIETLCPTFYAKEFLHVLNLPIVIYRAIGKYTQYETKQWLQDEDIKYTVFVGAASAQTSMSISIDKAYEMKKQIAPKIKLGGIAIPERHNIKKDEHERMLKKIQNGCEFFVTQAVYNLDVAKNFLDDYYLYMKKNNQPLVPIIFTLTPCGSTKTLEFMKWLGIGISQDLEKKLLNSEDILEESILVSLEIFTKLYEYGTQRGIPIGCNVESVSVRKKEILASIELLQKVGNIISK